MSTKYKRAEAVPTSVLADRLNELSCAAVAMMRKDGEKFKKEFTCSIPAQLDRDADLVLSEAANRLRKLSAMYE